MKQETNMNSIKEGDVFKFSYSQEYVREYKYDSSHCFDGQLIAKIEDGKIILVDTYWSFGGSDSRHDTPEEWAKKGTLKFYINLKDVEIVDEYKKDYFSENDWFNLSYQHNCYPKFAVRKGAKRDKVQMENALRELMKKAKSDADWAIRRVEEYAGKLAKLEAGNLDISICDYQKRV